MWSFIAVKRSGFEPHKGPDALDWQNLFGLSKILDKICLCQIFNLLNVGALRHSKILVNHKCQSHRNKDHRFARCSWERLHEISRVLGLLYVTVIFTASIECVASAYYSACEYSRFSFLRYCVSHVWEAAVRARTHWANFCLFCEKNLSQVASDKCARWVLDLPNFVKAYQTSKTSSSCLGAGQIFVRLEICVIWRKMSIKKMWFQSEAR